jgi:uridine kinase
VDRPSDASRVLDLTRSRPPTLGTGRLICVDGPAGSGKTTLAATLGAPVIHMDDLFEGWSGLRTVDARLDALLRPHVSGRPGSYRRYDWLAGEYADTVVVPPADLLVLEGVGSGSLVVADLVTVLVWIEAPHDVRMARGIARDGDTFAPHWERWAADEAEHFVQNRTRERADLVLRT